MARGLVLAAGLKKVYDHQVGIGKQPFLGSHARRFGCSRHRPEVFVARQSAQVLDADAGKAGDFFLSKKLLARLDSDHFRGLSICQMLIQA